MAAEDLRQPLGEVAGQAAARPFVQPQFHDQQVAPQAPVGQFDIVGPFAGIAEQGVKKIVGTPPGEETVQGFGGEQVLQGRGIHGVGWFRRVLGLGGTQSRRRFQVVTIPAAGVLSTDVAGGRGLC